MGAPPPPPPPPWGQPPAAPPPPPPGWGAPPPGAAPPPSGGGTDGFAIASLVLGIIGGSILAIIFGFVARSRIKRNPAKGGRGLATAGIILGFVWLLLCGGLIALALSGALDSENADDFTGEKKEVARTIDEVEDAFSDHDGDRACDELFTPSFKALLSAGGKSCAKVIEEGDDGKIQAEIDIDDIVLIGSTRALARVDEGGTDEVWTLVKRDRWRVDSIVER